MRQMKKISNAISTPYGISAKIILADSDIVCTFAAFKHPIRHKTVSKSSWPFLCPIFINMQANGLVVCGSSNARKDMYRSPEQHHKPFLFNVLKSYTMNAKSKTAGETAREQLTVGSYEERKNAMVQLLQNSGTAFMVYLDENCNIRTCGIAEDGYESMLLPMLDIATNKARRVAEEALL